MKLANIGDSVSKKILKQEILNANLLSFYHILRKNYLHNLGEEELNELINNLKDLLSKENDEDVKTNMLSILCMLYKEIEEETLAEQYYIKLLSSPNINKIILWKIRDAFPQFKNYKWCEAWRAVKKY